MPTTTKIYEANNFYTADNIADGVTTVAVEQDAYILASGDHGLEFNNNHNSGPFKITVDGYIESDKNGMALYDATVPIKNSTLTVGTEGMILGGAGFNGISTALGLDVTNSGLIQGDVAGISYLGLANTLGKTVTVTNNAGGAIHGNIYGINLDDLDMDLVLKNAGDINAVWWGHGAKITNSGTITGGLNGSGSFDAAADLITNSGTISQSISTAAGNDVVTNSGTISYFVNLSEGDNKVTNSGHIGADLVFGTGDDTVANTGSFGGDVKLGAGDNALTNGGTIGGEVDGAAGNDTVTNSGVIAGQLDLGDGANKITNSGSLDAIALGTGTDMLTNTGTIATFVDFVTGGGTLTNSGTIGGEVLMSGGVNKLTNTGQIQADIYLGGGIDTVTNSGTIGNKIDFTTSDVTLTNKGQILGLLDGDSAGTVKITNNGTIAGSVTTFLGDDIVTNTKLIDGDVKLGEGKNTLTNSGTIDGLVLTGGGDDIVTNTGHVTGTIELGTGKDKFTGGAFSDNVFDNAGDDTYNLGGGNDVLHWQASGTDSIDGGAGTADTLAGDGLGAIAMSVNLDTKDVTVEGHLLKGSTAVTSTGSATIKGFEQVLGASGDDVLAGSAGNDYLGGSFGADTLYGGKGADQLFGGGGSDTFVYLALTDSGNTKATRDTIEAFEGAGVSNGDVIDLSKIDADSKTVGDGTFHLVSASADAQFTGTAGELRWVHVNGDTILQGDVNGDMKADFSIEVTGVVNFIATDFNL